MHIVTRKTLAEFWQKHPTAESPLKVWFTRVRQSQWQSFAELRRDFPSADLVGRLTVFNIGDSTEKSHELHELARIFLWWLCAFASLREFFQWTHWWR